MQDWQKNYISLTYLSHSTQNLQKPAPKGKVLLEGAGAILSSSMAFLRIAKTNANGRSHTVPY
ncbi:MULTISPECIES: hypothetical protein [unclassified Microcoleus]|uniref:hypothetical protein n=1 Tax=unclassified Microcoleus TaxID=2642155 RepID=UPI002FD049AD